MGIDGNDINRERKRKERQREKKEEQQKHKEKYKEQQSKDKVRRDEKYAEYVKEQEENKRYKGVRLDCSACKIEKSMIATTVPRFEGIVRIIGYIIVIISIILIVINIFSVTGIIFVPFILVGGVLGWLLLLKKKVYRCENCSFIIDRG